MLSTWKTAPALAAGCTVVLKPAEWSPLSCSLLADLADEAGLPAGVLNVVQGIGEEVGAALVADPRARRISFTGSPETARQIGVSAARNLVPFTGELGGKGPLIVFADCDLDAAARKAAGPVRRLGPGLPRRHAPARRASRSPSRSSSCSTASRDAQVLGDPRDDATTMSPLIHPDHLARVEGFVERARAAGDEIVRGGQPRRRRAGCCTSRRSSCPRSNDSEIVQREVFGPVLTFQTFADEDEAIELANSTAYGLSAIVYTGQRRARRARRPRGARRARSGSTPSSSAT